MEELTIEFY